MRPVQGQNRTTIGMGILDMMCRRNTHGEPMTKPGKVILSTDVVLTLGLLVAHTLQWTRIKVDNVTLALVGILFVIPFFESLKKIRFGEFEAEIASVNTQKRPYKNT
jgi:hypothetical protein